ncbi:MAG: type II secretion system F family protein [Pseudomonadota bacterium]
MNLRQALFLLIVFGVVSGVALLAARLFAPGLMRQRLASVAAAPAGLAGHAGGGWIERVAKVAKPFMKLSLPEDGWEKSPLRTRFMNAGWRSQTAPILYFAAKTVLALALPGLVVAFGAPRLSVLLGHLFLFAVLASAGFGYYLPNAILTRTVLLRQREIFETFPDALDLLTVCIEAGLSLERAIGKVASEIHLKSVVLAQELQLVLMEMRAGFSKEKALRNLALRSGVEDIDTLVAMLIQSERFGTSMGNSLRVHSDNLRTKRRLRAEEAAAKIALKLLFPLIFLIFPTLLLVLLGPAMMSIYRVLVPPGGA